MDNMGSHNQCNVQIITMLHSLIFIVMNLCWAQIQSALSSDSSFTANVFLDDQNICIKISASRYVPSYKYSQTNICIKISIHWNMWIEISAKNSAQLQSQFDSDVIFTRQCPLGFLDHKLIKTRDFPDWLFPDSSCKKLSDTSWWVCAIC